MPNLRIVPHVPSPAAEKVRQRIKAAPKPAAMLQCRCGSREFVAALAGVESVNGKRRGGTKQLICLTCLIKGERVVVA